MKRIAAILLALAGCSGQPEADLTIRPADVAGAWPLEVGSIDIVCGSNRLAVFGEANNRAFPLNGSAISNSAAYTGRYPLADLKTIQKRDPDMAKYGDVLIDASDVVQIAVQRCKQPG